MPYLGGQISCGCDGSGRSLGGVIPAWDRGDLPRKSVVPSSGSRCKGATLQSASSRLGVFRMHLMVTSYLISEPPFCGSPSRPLLVPLLLNLGFCSGPWRLANSRLQMFLFRHR
eukprot:12650239-Heterocapsa_arctica.AAC.1